MRSTFRLLASVKPARYLEAGSPTGLTGLFTHPSPRSTLVYLYSRTLDAISEFPETSLYRQSTEALTKHRLNIVSAVEPEGYKEWSAKAKQIVSENPEAFARQDRVQGKDVSLAGKMTRELSDGKEFIKRRVVPEYDEREVEWDGEKALKGGVEVGTTVGFEDGTKKLELPEEPLLTVAQIEEIENKIGAGLIEEVIQVAEGELKLVDVLKRAEVWQDLEEKPVEGQWSYFMRDTATPTT
ncbi:NADH-ubiquinone oxidoreductase 29.9 kDa subunit, mitochondrial [Lachnellula willkommii]|uniref:NADH-ubiquinone oxidoreductase 29.9 kDa subunit, mitochondrial n=1 Tax=Lachnellula willkommii TaxID=215461 RepID=A0A559MNJ4_9HELO|nr:NADH-ubiquinone oxidoreductase 29.9 kDa subunit, mitochondrial [Lachnellula willkommii]